MAAIQTIGNNTTATLGSKILEIYNNILSY